MGFFDKLKSGLFKTKSAIVDKIDNIFKSFAKVDDDLFDELEEILSSNTEGSISEENIGKLISDFLRGRGRDERNVFIRKYYFFDSVEEIAARYSFTESKVKNMLYRTRQRLKEYLIKEGIEL